MFVFVFVGLFENAGKTILMWLLSYSEFQFWSCLLSQSYLGHAPNKTVFRHILHDVLHTCTCPNSVEFLSFALLPDIWQMMKTCSNQLSCGCIAYYNLEYATGWHCLSLVFLQQYCEMHLALYFQQYRTF